MPYTSIVGGASVRDSLKESVIGHPEIEVKKIFGIHDVERSQRGHPIRMNQWSDQQDGEKQKSGSDDGGMPPREEKKIPGDGSSDTKYQTPMQTHTGEQQKEGSGSTRQGDQERQTPEKEDLSQRRSGRRNEIRSGIKIRTVYEQNLYLFT